MKPNPKLTLKREALSTLVSDDLVSVVGGSVLLACTYTCECSHGATCTATGTATGACPTDYCTQYCIPQLTHIQGRCHT